MYGGQEPRRTGARHASISPYGPFTATAQVFLGLQNEREWRGAVREGAGPAPSWSTDPRFATNPDRVAHNDELTAIIEDVLATRRRTR